LTLQDVGLKRLDPAHFLLERPQCQEGSEWSNVDLPAGRLDRPGEHEADLRIRPGHGILAWINPEREVTLERAALEIGLGIAEQGSLFVVDTDVTHPRHPAGNREGAFDRIERQHSSVEMAG